MINVATEIAPSILKEIATLDFTGDDNKAASQLAERVVAVVGPALMKITEFESVLLNVAFEGRPEAADDLDMSVVFAKRDDAASAIFAGLSREVGFWSGLVKQAKGLGSAVQKS